MPRSSLFQLSLWTPKSTSGDMRRVVFKLLFVAALCGTVVVVPGCSKHFVVDRQLHSMRDSQPAIDTIGDLDVARVATYANLATLERLRWVSPRSSDGLLLLTQEWVRAGFRFIEDDWEVATDAGEDEVAEEHQIRARGAYTRAVFYGLELLEQKAQDFQLVRHSPQQLRAWLKNFGNCSVDALFWTAAAWFGRGLASKDIPQLAGDLDVGVAMLERVIELDETYGNGLAHVALGAYYARATTADLEQARVHFERALQISQGRHLIAKVLFARTYYCVKNDKTGYSRLLNEVLRAGDPIPEQRLSNTVAQRRAKRYLTDVRMADCGF